MLKTWNSRFRNNMYIYIHIIAFLAFLPSERACANLQIVKLAHARKRFLVSLEWWNSNNMYIYVLLDFLSSRGDAEMLKLTLIEVQ